jgi:AbrB family looped-hinge helix DNA binding protein
MKRKNSFRFNATVSDRGQIFIPKALQDYFGIASRDKVQFLVRDGGEVVFKKKEAGHDIQTF